MTPVLFLLLSYLIGAIPFGYLVGRWRGVDIFREGSGNIGATNVGRVLGRRFGVLVLVLDFAKGAVPTATGTWLADWIAPSWPPHALPVAAGLAAFLGHLYSVYLRFRGGKGVATGAGVVAVLLPLSALGALLVWIGLVCATRFVSLASIAAVLSLCLFHWAQTPAPFAPAHVVLSTFCLIAAGLVVVKHRGNVTRLLAGTENRVEESTMMYQLTKTVHVLALGLWFGMAVFFSFPVALTLFATFEREAMKPAADRPLWFPLAEQYAQEPPHERFPNPLRKEQGTRAAGVAVAPLFDWYFLLQGACGFLAVATALAWRGQPPDRLNRLRLLILLAALATVVAGWPLEQHVSQLRVVRNEATDVVLKQVPNVSTTSLEAALAARATFGLWHFYSLMLNFATLGLVTVGMALAAQLPPERKPITPGSST